MDDKPVVATIDSRFAAFHAANPHVYQTLVAMARQALQNGHQRLGVRTLWEAMRWELMFQTRRPEGDFKLNDHFTSRYVRLIVAQEQDLAPLFELRRLRAN